jgi:hypothetical protein
VWNIDLAELRFDNPTVVLGQGTFGKVRERGEGGEERERDVRDMRYYIYIYIMTLSCLIYTYQNHESYPAFNL